LGGGRSTGCFTQQVKEGFCEEVAEYEKMYQKGTGRTSLEDGKTKTKALAHGCFSFIDEQ
jgi:hypothetical protein